MDYDTQKRLRNYEQSAINILLLPAASASVIASLLLADPWNMIAALVSIPLFAWAIVREQSRRTAKSSNATRTKS